MDATPRPGLASVGYTDRHSAALCKVLPDELERDTMIAFVARELQPAPQHAVDWVHSVAIALATRRPRIEAEEIAIAAQAVILLAFCVELRPERARLN